MEEWRDPLSAAPGSPPVTIIADGTTTTKNEPKPPRPSESDDVLDVVPGAETDKAPESDATKTECEPLNSSATLCEQSESEAAPPHLAVSLEVDGGEQSDIPDGRKRLRRSQSELGRVPDDMSEADLPDGPAREGGGTPVRKKRDRSQSEIERSMLDRKREIQSRERELVHRELEFERKVAGMARKEHGLLQRERELEQRIASALAAERSELSRTRMQIQEEARRLQSLHSSVPPSAVLLPSVGRKDAGPGRPAAGGGVTSLRSPSREGGRQNLAAFLEEYMPEDEALARSFDSSWRKVVGGARVVVEGTGEGEHIVDEDARRRSLEAGRHAPPPEDSVGGEEGVFVSRTATPLGLHRSGTRAVSIPDQSAEIEAPVADAVVNPSADKQKRARTVSSIMDEIPLSRRTEVPTALIGVPHWLENVREDSPARPRRDMEEEDAVAGVVDGDGVGTVPDRDAAKVAKDTMEEVRKGDVSVHMESECVATESRGAVEEPIAGATTEVQEKVASMIQKEVVGDEDLPPLRSHPVIVDPLSPRAHEDQDVSSALVESSQKNIAGKPGPKRPSKAPAARLGRAQTESLFSSAPNAVVRKPAPLFGADDAEDDDDDIFSGGSRTSVRGRRGSQRTWANRSTQVPASSSDTSLFQDTPDPKRSSGGLLRLSVSSTSLFGEESSSEDGPMTRNTVSSGILSARDVGLFDPPDADVPGGPLRAESLPVLTRNVHARKTSPAKDNGPLDMSLQLNNSSVPICDDYTPKEEGEHGGAHYTRDMLSLADHIEGLAELLKPPRKVVGKLKIVYHDHGLDGWLFLFSDSVTWSFGKEMAHHPIPLVQTWLGLRMEDVEVRLPPKEERSKKKKSIFSREKKQEEYLERTLVDQRDSADTTPGDPSASDNGKGGGRQNGAKRKSMRRSARRFLSYTFNDGNQYSGQWLDGRFDGEGALQLANGDSYEGGFEKGHKHGYGMMRQGNGESYEGEFFEDKRHGTGTAFYPSGNREGIIKFAGTWVRNEKHGKGHVYFANGDHMTARYVHDVAVFPMCMTYTSGDVFVGSLRVNPATGQHVRDGFGIGIYVSGERYYGSWSADMRSGRGFFITPNGTEFNGQWEGDVVAGKGSIRFSSDPYFTLSGKFSGSWTKGMALQVDGQLEATPPPALQQNNENAAMPRISTLRGEKWDQFFRHHFNSGVFKRIEPAAEYEQLVQSISSSGTKEKRLNERALRLHAQLYRAVEANADAVEEEVAAIFRSSDHPLGVLLIQFSSLFSMAFGEVGENYSDHLHSIAVDDILSFCNCLTGSAVCQLLKIDRRYHEDCTTAMKETLMPMLYPSVFRLYGIKLEDRDTAIATKLRKLSELQLWERMSLCGIDRKYWQKMTDIIDEEVQANAATLVPSVEDTPFQSAVSSLRQLTLCTTPRAKLDCIKQYVVVVPSRSARTFGADELLPMFCLVVMHAGMSKLQSESSYIDDFLDDAMRFSVYGYLLAQLQIATNFVHSLDINRLKWEFGADGAEESSKPGPAS